MEGMVFHGLTGFYRTRIPNYGNRALSSKIDESFAVIGIKLNIHSTSELKDRGRRGKVVALPSLSHKTDSIQTDRSDLGPKPIVPPTDPSGKPIISSASDFQSILSTAKVQTDKGHDELKMAGQASRSEKDMLVLVAEAKKIKAEFESVRKMLKEIVEKQQSQIMERTYHLKEGGQLNRLRCLSFIQKTKQREEDLSLARARLYELKEKKLEQLKITGSPIKYK
ncbi:Hypothetical predicted protein [Pelobates cultripes]|uniref:Uncharacterized protein n=1 Tax=Pelobates cultripes TaxID=61616 RepID=A0AAD1WLG4_PELCU|nr:Hypothetical predicted protein [Pelobates cultripes]